ncbi:hypothetical protein ACFX13_047346 [Malus domestica]
MQALIHFSLKPNAYGVPDPSLKFLPEPVDIRASSNGFLCCLGRDGYKAYYICNPITRKWTKLPKPNADHGFLYLMRTTWQRIWDPRSVMDGKLWIHTYYKTCQKLNKSKKFFILKKSKNPRKSNKESLQIH